MFRKAYIILFVALFFAAIAVVNADPGANIRVIPVGGVHSGDPIVTTSPAEIMIYSTSHTPIENVWLILAINEETYDHLNTIKASACMHPTITFMKSDFSPPTESKVPPEAASGAYPGCKTGAQYEVNAIKSKTETPTSEKIYYAYKKFSIDPITTTVQTFTITVDAPSITHMKVLVLANGCYEGIDTAGDHKLNEKTPWSGSTLVVPECCGTLFATIASFAALGLVARKAKRTF